jgi:hypothetical protein
MLWQTRYATSKTPWARDASCQSITIGSRVCKEQVLGAEVGVGDGHRRL